MSLIKKIEHIRQQPEAVRLRYVWLCLSISMFFVFTIWILSVQTNFPKIPNFTKTIPNNANQENTNTTAPSLQEMLQNSSNTSEVNSATEMTEIHDTTNPPKQ